MPLIQISAFVSEPLVQLDGLLAFCQLLPTHALLSRPRDLISPLPLHVPIQYGVFLLIDEQHDQPLAFNVQPLHVLLLTFYAQLQHELLVQPHVYDFHSLRAELLAFDVLIHYAQLLI